MKRVLVHVSNSLVLSSVFTSFLASATQGGSGGQLHRVVKEGSEYKLTYCQSTGVDDGDKVDFIWSNGVEAFRNRTLSKGWVDNKICTPQLAISENNPHLKDRKALNVYLKKNPGRLVATFTAEQILGSNSSPPAPVAVNYSVTAIRTTNESKIQVKICGGDLKASESISFRIGQNGIRQIEPVTKEKEIACAKKEYLLSVLTPLQGPIQIFFSRGNKDLLLQDVTALVRGTSSSGGVPSTPRPPVGSGQTAPSPVPQQPALPSIDRITVENMATEASTLVVKYIVETLGRIERIRLNFFKGYLDIKQQNETEAARSTSEYRRGARQSEIESEKISAQGVLSGQELANLVAKREAEAAVKERIYKTPSGQLPDFNLPQNLNFSSTISKFNGHGTYRSPVRSMDDRLMALDQEIQNKLRPLFVKSESEITLAEDFFKLNYGTNQGETIRNFKDKLVVNSAERGRNAFLGFKENKFPSGRSEALQRDYFEMSRGFEKGRDAQKWFEMTFVKKYNMSIESRWNETVNADTLEARQSYTLGLNTYQELFKSFSEDLGRFEKSNEIYWAAQIQRFADSYEQAYRKHFAQLAHQAMTSSLVEIRSEDVFITGSSGDLKHLTLGDSLSVQLRKAINFGGQGDVVRVLLHGSGLVMKDSVSFEIPGFSTQAQKAFESIAQIEEISSTQVDSVKQISLRFTGKGIDKTIQSFEIRVTLEALLRKLATDSQGTYTERLVKNLFGYLKNEWESNAGAFGTVYDNTDEEADKLVIKRLAKFFKNLSEPNQKENIKRHMPEIIKAFNGGKRPTGLFSTTKDDFDAVMEIIKEAGLQ